MNPFGRPVQKTQTAKRTWYRQPTLSATTGPRPNARGVARNSTKVLVDRSSSTASPRMHNTSRKSHFPLPNAHMLECSNAQMLSCSNAQMLSCSNAQMHKCTRAKSMNTNCSNTKCTNAKCTNKERRVLLRIPNEQSNETLLCPKINSSATLPPMAFDIFASKYSLE